MNTQRKKSRLAGALGVFVQKYARKAANGDPNDRQYDRKLAKRLRHMAPEDLSRLLTEEIDEINRDADRES
ncbi:DUF3008 family protein [Pararobbsia alpina]